MATANEDVNVGRIERRRVEKPTNWSEDQALVNHSKRVQKIVAKK